VRGTKECTSEIKTHATELRYVYIQT
jgi:hypothetical protein